VSDSDIATAEDLIALTFDPIPDAKAPSRDDWMRWAQDDHQTLTVAMATLRHSNTELAEIVGKQGQFETWGAMLDSLFEMEKAHGAVVEEIERIKTRLLIAIHQAYPDAAALSEKASDDQVVH
jgi:hypothetical protein